MERLKGDQETCSETVSPRKDRDASLVTLTMWLLKTGHKDITNSHAKRKGQSHRALSLDKELQTTKGP